MYSSSRRDAYVNGTQNSEAEARTKQHRRPTRFFEPKMKMMMPKNTAGGIATSNGIKICNLQRKYPVRNDRLSHGFQTLEQKDNNRRIHLSSDQTKSQAEKSILTMASL